jgi:hypothetical protein
VVCADAHEIKSNGADFAALSLLHYRAFGPQGWAAGVGRRVGRRGGPQGGPQGGPLRPFGGRLIGAILGLKLFSRRRRLWRRAQRWPRGGYFGAGARIFRTPFWPQKGKIRRAVGGLSTLGRGMPLHPATDYFIAGCIREVFTPANINYCSRKHFARGTPAPRLSSNAGGLSDAAPPFLHRYCPQSPGVLLRRVISAQRGTLTRDCPQTPEGYLTRHPCPAIVLKRRRASRRGTPAPRVSSNAGGLSDAAPLPRDCPQTPEGFKARHPRSSTATALNRRECFDVFCHRHILP